MQIHGFALIVSLALVGSAHAATPDAAFVTRVGDAIARVVGKRMGPGATVRVEQVRVTATPSDETIDVTPAPDARTGRPSLYSLTVTTPSGPRRIGSAMATAVVEADLLRATRALTRGDEVSEADVVATRGEAAGVSLKRLPIASETVGARMTRAVEEGAVLSNDVLSVQWLVRSGQQVRLRALVEGIEAHGLGIATEHGRAGAIVRVVNPESKRTLLGRVVGLGEIEVIHGS
jgi:flagella basal body P-ring formation protein FlgA